jgi:SAM-dependent methyltransferase
VVHSGRLFPWKKAATMAHHHHHDHDHTAPDWAEMAPQLERSAETAAPVHLQTVAWLRELHPHPKRIIDAGSGPGVVTCLLAQSFPGAEVVAVDSAAPLLELAEARAARAGLGDRMRTLQAELPAGLAGLQPADIIWAGRSLHHIGDQRAALAAFAARLAPGGVLALLEGGLPTRWLPRDIGFGRPGLQSRLDAIEEDWFAAMRAALPGTEQVTEDWPALLTSAIAPHGAGDAPTGLRHGGTRSFLLDLAAPLHPDIRLHAVDVFTRRRASLAESLAADDLAALDRLLDPADPGSLLQRPDVFVLGAQTVHLGVKPDTAPPDA